MMWKDERVFSGKGNLNFDMHKLSDIHIKLHSILDGPLEVVERQMNVIEMNTYETGCT